MGINQKYSNIVKMASAAVETKRGIGLKRQAVKVGLYLL